MRRTITALAFALIATSYQPKPSNNASCRASPVTAKKASPRPRTRPRSGGQQAPYTLIQLFMFREKLRTFEADERDGEGADRRRSALFLGLHRQDTEDPQPRPRPAILRGCSAARRWCRQAPLRHLPTTPDFSGKENVPRIANQREDYLAKTLAEYKDNSRHGYDGSMADVMGPITPSRSPISPISSPVCAKSGGEPAGIALRPALKGRQSIWSFACRIYGACRLPKWLR
jgi:cytochrome c553